MRRQDRDITVIGQSLGMGRFEDGSGVALVFGNGDDRVDIVFLDKAVQRGKEIIPYDEIEFGTEFIEHLRQSFLSLF